MRATLILEDDKTDIVYMLDEIKVQMHSIREDALAHAGELDEPTPGRVLSQTVEMSGVTKKPPIFMPRGATGRPRAGQATRELVRGMVEAIVRDLSDRSGLGSEWDMTEPGIQDEIKAAWLDIALHALGVK